MDQQDLRTLRILEEIEKDQSPSQRELARKLNISLGLVNSFVKRLAQKGYFKVTTIPKNRIKYILTPKGFTEKTKLTYEYIQFSYRFYKGARMRLRKLFQDFINNNDHSVIFFGVGNLAEIAYLSHQETTIELVAIIDETMAGNKFFNMVIEKPDTIIYKTFDKILVTSDNSNEAVLNQIKKIGIQHDKIAVV